MKIAIQTTKTVNVIVQSNSHQAWLLICVLAPTTHDSRDEGVSQEDSHDCPTQERKSTRSRSPTSPLSGTDDRSDTDATDYGDDGGVVRGMNMNDILDAFSEDNTE